MELARYEQSLAVRMIQAIAQHPFHPAMKEVLRILGHDCGPCRLPQPRLTPANVDELRGQLNSMGFFDALRKDGGAGEIIIPVSV